MSRKKNLDMPLINFLLQNYKEEIPMWLKNYQKGDDINQTLENFLSSRTLFYPGCGSDGTPVALFNSAHCIHCFVYADIFIEIDKAKEELTSTRYGFKGYTIFDMVILPSESLSKYSQAPYFSSLDEGIQSAKNSFAILAIYEREKDYTDAHGAERFALLFLGDDANAAYEKWFCNAIARPPYILLIQVGFDNRHLNAGGPMNKISEKYHVFPKFLYVESHCTPWEGYQRLPGIPFGYASEYFRRQSFISLKSDFHRRVLYVNLESCRKQGQLPSHERLALKNAKRKAKAIAAQKRAETVFTAYKRFMLSPEIPLEMVAIPSGYFEMGQDYNENSCDYASKYESPKHQVHISKSFMLSAFPIYQEQYQQIMGKNPSIFQDPIGCSPVENVSWYDAKAFCEKLNEIFRSKLPQGYHFDLPTEAQWEYACKAGSIGELYNEESVITPQKLSSRYNSSNVDELAWFIGNSKGSTNEVGAKNPNNWGLRDMLGNVCEWCLDWYDEYPSSNHETDYRGPETGTSKVCRGGSWKDYAYKIRISRRWDNPPDTQTNTIGFRVALVPDDDSTVNSKRVFSSADKEKVLHALEHTSKSIDDILNYIKG